MSPGAQPVGEELVEHGEAFGWKFLADLAWETEAWCASDPTHMIHLNGDVCDPANTMARPVGGNKKRNSAALKHSVSISSLRRKRQTRLMQCFAATSPAIARPRASTPTPLISNAALTIAANGAQVMEPVNE